jgi:hypothetical protein
MGGEDGLDPVARIGAQDLLEPVGGNALAPGVSTISTSRPWRWHMSIQRWLNMPLRAASTVSPGDSVLVIAASQPPVPVAGKMKTSAVSDFRILPHAVPRGMQDLGEGDDRWSIVGMSQALRRVSGMFVGPGMNTGF